MGRNYGQRRGRLEPLNPTPMVGYALGETHFKWEKFDHRIIADAVNERLDRAEKRFRELE